MTVEIISKADPLAVEDIPRDFIPDEVREWDLNAIQAITLGLDPNTVTGLVQRGWTSFRVMSVYAVSRVDANKIKVLRAIVGPGLGEQPVVLAPVDWAWVQDYRNARGETLKRRAAARAQRLPELQRAMEEGLVREAHEQAARKVGRSTFGPGGNTQRVSP